MKRRRLEPKPYKRVRRTSSYDWYSSVAKYLPEAKTLEKGYFYYTIEGRSVFVGYKLINEMVHYGICLSKKDGDQEMIFENFQSVPPEKAIALSSLFSLWLQGSLDQKDFELQHSFWCGE